MVGVSIILTYLICASWVKNCSTSTLAFDIVQFFLSLNHQLLSKILNKAGFNSRVCQFFNNYMVGRKTKYLQNDFSSYYFDISSALFSILSALYLSLIFYVFEKRLKILKIPVLVLSFVDNRLFIAQNKSLYISNSNLFCSYKIMSCLFKQFGLIIEHGKTEVFHFSRSQGIFNFSLLDLSILGGSVLCPKESWRYLRFIFDIKLYFHQYIDFYANKTISIVKSMKMLENSSRGLILFQKYLLYRSCVSFIILYRFLLQFYNNTPLSYLLKVLRVMQHRAAI